MGSGKVKACATGWIDAKQGIVVDGHQYPQTGAGIQAALSALPSTGGMVLLSAGTYVATTTILIPSGASLIGSGPSTVIKKSPGVAMGIISNSNSNGSATGTQDSDIVISDLKILGESTATTNYAIRMENVTNFRIENVWCQDILTGDSGAINIDSCQRFFVRGCHVNNVTNNGIRVRCQAEDSTDFVISDNIVDTTASQNGIFAANSASFACKRFSIAGNVVKSVGDVGIEVGNTGAAAHADFSVSGNQVTNAAGDGILIRNAISGTVCGNEVDLGGAAASSAGIGLLASAVDCTDITISGNTVTGRTNGASIRTGLSSTFRCRRVAIVGNIIRGGTGSTNGIDFQGFSEDSVISGNILTNVQSTGISLVGSSGSARPIDRTVVSGNLVNGAILHGLSADNITNSFIHGNMLINCTGFGINFSDSPASNVISANILRGNISGASTGLAASDIPLFVGTGSFTATTAGLTTISNSDVLLSSRIVIFPSNAAAGLLMRSKSCWIDTVANGSFNFNVSSTGAGAPAGTETFGYSY